MQPSHITTQTRRPNRWQPTMSRRFFVRASSMALIALLLVASGSDAIVKQQRSDDVQPKSSSGASQQQQQQSAYNNHQSQPSSSSSIGQSSPAQSVGASSSYSVSSSSASSPASGVGSQASQQYSSYMPTGQSNKLGGYMSDSMAPSSANSQDQSYQAAAQSVQMALANSGIFGPTAQSTSSAGQQQQQQQQQSVSAVNPQHYHYYPSKESSSAAAAKAASDLLNNAASNNYQSMAYSNYADQLGSALSGMGAPLESAASSQDPSYLPQPGADQFGGQNGAQQPAQQQQAQQNAGAFNDMSSFSSNNNVQQPQQQSSNQQGSISFGGPTNGNGLMGPQSAAGQQQGDYQGSQLGSPAPAGQAQQVSPLSAYSSSSLYNQQLGDLSTSNFGNNAGGLSSVASYMSPSQQQQAGQALDMFANLGNSAGQFSSAASQLSPAAVSPPGVQQQQQQGAQQQPQQQNSLFGSAFNPTSTQQQQQQTQQQQQQSLFTNPQYLSSFLTQNQFSHLQNAGSPQQTLYGDGQMTGAASVPAATSVVPTASNSGKRFGISSFIMPMLALAGLSLLIPTMSNIGTAVAGRKKRSIQESEFDRKQTIAYEPMNGFAGQLAKENSIGEYMDRIERYYAIYKNAVESEDCLNRLICEFGDAVKDVTGKSAVVMVIEKLVPTWMTGKVHLFKEAALNEKESGKDKCKKYVCHSNKRAH